MSAPISVPARDAGTAAVEYGLLVGLVAVALLAALTTFGQEVAASYEHACAALRHGGASASGSSGHGVGLATAPGQHRRRC